MRLADILLLVLLQSIWAGTYTAIKIALEELSVDALILLRYGGAAIALFLVTTFARKHTRVQKSDIKWVFLLGVLVYVVSPLLAFRGIAMSQAIDVSVLVSLEPLLTTLLAYFILKERIDRSKVLAICLAIPGVLLLSGIYSMDVGETSTLRLLGNLLFMTSLLCEGSHTITGRALVKRYNPLALSTYGFMAGWLVFVCIRGSELKVLWQNDLSWQTWAAVIYLALIGSTFGYTAWFFLLRRLTANTVALSLYLQPIVGAIIGYTLLNERLDGWGLVGAAMILLAVGIGFFGNISKGLRQKNLSEATTL